MKLLLDQHLSRRLVPKLQAIYPGTAHVIEVDLDRADDEVLWQFAIANGFTICTKDSDFQHPQLRPGTPAQGGSADQRERAIP